MFQGTIPSNVQMMLGEIVGSWNASDIYVGCSGNFTVERVLHNHAKARLHGNDVTAYSCLIGDYLAGNELGARFNPKYDGPMSFVEKYITDDASVIAVTLILSKLADALKSKKRNAYYERLIQAYKDQWETIFASQYNLVLALPKMLTSFCRGDVCEWVKGLDKSQGFICHLPFYKGGYEKMFAAIEDVIAWAPPEYEMIDQEKIHALFEEAMGFRHFLFVINKEMPELKKNLIGLAQTTNRGTPLYVYANHDRSRIVMPSQKATTPAIARLGQNDDVGETISLVKLQSAEFQGLRSQYLNPHIKPASESLALGVVVDKKLVGAFAVSVAPTMGNFDKHVSTPTVYLLSDFPVAPSKYKRLAKLVLYAALSKESKLIMEMLSNRRARTLITTAFSKKPVSMKYRGLFDLVSKKELDGVDENETDMSKIYYGSGFQLNYAAPLGAWTLQEGLALWKKKCSQVEQKEEVCEVGRPRDGDRPAGAPIT